MNQKLIDRALEAIESNQILLVYPLKAKAKILSLWEVLYPRSKMNWDWSEAGDSKVATIWRLREVLAESQQVVYSKWYKDRATFFSKQAFKQYLSFIEAAKQEDQLSRVAQDIYDSLRETSPQSTKQLKESTGLRGKLFSSSFDRSLKELFRKGLIVGVGEVDDGAFPSLNIAATRLIFEDIWKESQKLSAKSLPFPEAALVQAFSIKKSPFAK